MRELGVHEISEILSKVKLEWGNNFEQTESDNMFDQKQVNPSDSSIYSIDGLLDEVFAVPEVKVSYPDYLVKELQALFRQSYNFIDALMAGDPKAINYLTDIATYSKAQLDAYTHLFTWLVENGFEFGDVTASGQDIDGEYQEVDGDDKEQDGKDASKEGKKGDNKQDDNGDTQDSSKMTKSKSPSNNIQETQGEGQVQKEGKGASSSIGKDKSETGEKVSPKKGKALWDKMKDVLKDRVKPPTKTTKESQTTIKEKEETPADIKGRETANKINEVFKDIEKDLYINEAGTETEKTDSDQDNERHEIYKPGGRDIAVSKAEVIVKEWIEKAAFAGIHMKTAGYDKWDRRKIAKHVVTNQSWKIPSAKYSHLPDEVMFMLDFSGSCAWISKTFARLGQAASEFDHVTVAFGGYEGYVQGFIKPDFDLSQVEEHLYSRGMISSLVGGSNPTDVSLGEYLYKHQAIKTVFILGDYDGTQRYVDAYYKHRHVRFIWFLCERYSNYRGYDLGGLKHHIYYFDGSVEGLAKLINRIKL